MIESASKIEESQSNNEKAKVLIDFGVGINEITVFSLFFNNFVYEDIIKRSNEEYLNQSLKRVKKKTNKLA